MASPRKRRQGERLVDVIERIPIAIPYVCYHPQLGAIQTCDNCMVEVNGALVRACATVTADGMAVHTTSQKATAAQVEALDDAPGARGRDLPPGELGRGVVARRVPALGDQGDIVSARAASIAADNALRRSGRRAMDRLDAILAPPGTCSHGRPACSGVRSRTHTWASTVNTSWRRPRV